MLGSISLSLIYFAEAEKEGAALARGETEVVGTSLLYTAAALAVILKPAFVSEGQNLPSSSTFFLLPSVHAFNNFICMQMGTCECTGVYVHVYSTFLYRGVCTL